jgi:hypothetical protein
MIKYDDIDNKVKIIEKLFEDCRSIMRKFCDEIEILNKDKLPENDLIELKKNYTDIQKVLKFLKKNLGCLMIKEEDVKNFDKFLDTLTEIRNDRAHQRKIAEDRCADHFKSIENGLNIVSNLFPNIVKNKYLQRLVKYNNVFSNKN